MGALYEVHRARLDLDAYRYAAIMAGLYAQFKKADGSAFTLADFGVKAPQAAPKTAEEYWRSKYTQPEDQKRAILGQALGVGGKPNG